MDESPPPDVLDVDGNGPAIARPGLLPAVANYWRVDRECEILAGLDQSTGQEMWCFGVIAEWRLHVDGSWTAWVSWSPPGG